MGAVAEVALLERSGSASWLEENTSVQDESVNRFGPYAPLRPQSPSLWPEVRLARSRDSHGVPPSIGGVAGVSVPGPACNAVESGGSVARGVVVAGIGDPGLAGGAISQPGSPIPATKRVFWIAHGDSQICVSNPRLSTPGRAWPKASSSIGKSGAGLPERKIPAEQRPWATP